MSGYHLRRVQRIDRPVDEVFRFFADARNLEWLTPPWLRFRILTAGEVLMEAGARIEYSIRWRGIPIRWLTEIEEWEPDRRFVDVQRAGPYRLWHHTHVFTPLGNQTVMEDEVRYALPLGVLGGLMHGAVVGRDIGRIFDFRARKIAEAFSSRPR